jgi:hypothetical protein
MRRRQTKGRFGAAALAALALVAAICVGGVTAAKPGVVTSGIPEIGGSVMLLGKFDWQIGECSRGVVCWGRGPQAPSPWEQQVG